MNLSFIGLAFRNITRNKRRSAFTLLAIFFGLTVVLLIKGIADGFIAMTIDGVVKSRIGAIQIHKKGYADNLAGNPTSFNFEFSDSLKTKLLSHSHVTAIAPRLNFSGVISNGKNQTLFFATGLEPSFEKMACPLSPKLIKLGTELASDDRGKIIIGEELASSFGVSIESITEGKTLTLSGASPNGRQNALDVLVKGTAAASNALAEKRFITLPLKDAGEITGLGENVTEIVVAVEKLEQIAGVKKNIQNSLGDEFEVTDWQENQPFLRDIIFRQTIIISIITVVLFILVLFLVANTMLMTVHERTREIGTMLALGVKKKQILAVFLWEALALGILGASLGIMGGSIINHLLAKNGIEFVAIFEKSLLRPQVSTMFTVASFLAACICTIIAGFIPALHASNLDPVEALRT